MFTDIGILPFLLFCLSVEYLVMNVRGHKSISCSHTFVPGHRT